MPKNFGRAYDFDQIPDDEPICLFRARDLLAVEALRFYVKRARELRKRAPHLAEKLPDEDVILSISGHADRMERYAMEHGGFKRADM